MKFDRHRRLRSSQVMRNMVKETYVHKSDLIYPIFVIEEDNIKNEISSMPGIYQLSLNLLEQELNEAYDLGIRGVMFFGIPNEKDACGTGAFIDDGIIQKATRLSKSKFPDMLVVADTCLCEYTDHGHCGVIDETTHDVDNDESLKLLVKTAVSQAKAGADIIAPSNMMDGFVTEIRQGLDEAGFKNIPIMSYGIKYASSFYGPFRDAVGSASNLKGGNKYNYQMDVGNRAEALHEIALDIQEGADMVIVKPGMPYLDIVREVKDTFGVPTFVYQVSGEYAMLAAAIQNGWLSDSVILESLMSCRRAGADGIWTYFAEEAALKLKDMK